jgi:hypothetical protein
VLCIPFPPAILIDFIIISVILSYTTRVRFRAGTGKFSPRHRVQIGSTVYPPSYQVGARDSFPGVKRPGREVDHSHPSSAEVKKAWSCTSTHPIRLHGVVLNSWCYSWLIVKQTEKFTITFYESILCASCLICFLLLKVVLNKIQETYWTVYLTF